MPSIYKAYSIRGVWGVDIDERLAELLGKAFVTLVKPRRIVVARDGRLSSPACSRALITGIRSLGVDVVDIGMVPIDVFYYCIDQHGFDGGAMVTASHNPAEWNGLKFMRAHAVPLIGDDNAALGRIAESGRFVSIRSGPGAYETKNVTQDYVNLMLAAGNFDGGRRLKIVIDPGNGVAATVLPIILQRLPCEWQGINMAVDGGFPSRDPDPSKKGALEGLADAVVAARADLGMAFDADADRVLFVDSDRNVLRTGIPIVFLARKFLKQKPNAAVVYNLICSRAVPEGIAAAGGRPIRAGVGNINMIPAIRKTNAVFGGETAGHFRFLEHNVLDSAIMAMVVMLDYLSHEKKTFTELVREINRYVYDTENVKVDDVSVVIARVRHEHRQGAIDELDGLTVEYPDWWFNARPSNTEPLLRLTVEAKTKEEMEKRRDELLELIRNN